MYANIWMALSQTAIDEFLAKRRSGRPIYDEDGTITGRYPIYDGPMDEKTFLILKRMSDSDRVQESFSPVNLGGLDYKVFSIPVPATSTVKEYIDYVTGKWPSHVAVLGAWWWDGRQVGTQFEYDVDGEVIGTTGTPAYPIHAQTWRFIPGAASNASLRDINLYSGQPPRNFEV